MGRWMPVARRAVRLAAGAGSRACRRPQQMALQRLLVVLEAGRFPDDNLASVGVLDQILPVAVLRLETSETCDNMEDIIIHFAKFDL